MSKAFTRESDDIPERPLRPAPSSPLPPGAKNYLTRRGAEKLREELNRLIELERPRLVALAQHAETKAQLQILDERIHHLQQSLQTATVVTPPADTETKVRFGATVSVRHGQGEVTQYRIVGLDETDVDRGWVCWFSPIAKALLNSSVGARVRFKVPSGEEELEIVSVTYDEV